MTSSLCVSPQGDLGPTGPPGHIGETGYGLPGPKVGRMALRESNYMTLII